MKTKTTIKTIPIILGIILNIGLIGFNCFAQQYSIGNVKIIPANPKETDSIQIVIQMTSPRCTSTYTAASNQLNFYFLWNDIDTPHVDTINLGKLPVGNKQLSITLNKIFHGMGPSGIVIDTTVVDTSSLSFTVQFSVGLNEKINNEIASVYPNPNDGTFTIELHNVKGISQNSKVNILDIFGRVVYQSEIVNLKSETVNLKSQIKEGMYLLKIQGDKQMYYQQITIRK